MNPFRSRALRRAILLPVIAYCVVIAMLWFWEKSLVYHPMSATEGDWSIGARKGFEDVTFAAADGTRLHGWFKDHHERRAVVLFLHGNGGNVPLWSYSVDDMIRRHRVAALVFDYRGYGKSEGTPGEDGLYADTRAARKWLAERTGVRESDVVLVGRSLGGGVAVHAASEVAPRGMVLISTFTTLPAVAGYQFPWVPTSLLMSQRFDSLSKIKTYEGPLLSAHGDADRTIPFAMGEALFAAAPSSNKTFIRMPGVGHNDEL